MPQKTKQKSSHKGHARGVTASPKNHVLENAIQHYRAGRLSEADRLVQKHLTRHPIDADAVNLAGLIAHQSGKYDTAIRLLQSAVQLNSKDHCYHNNLGAVLKDSGDLTEAVRCFEKSLELEPSYVFASYNLGCAYQTMGELSLAKRWYETALSQEPDCFLAYSNLVCLYKDMGDVEKAIEGLKIAIQQNPENAFVDSNLIFCMNYVADTDPQTVFEYHRKWAKRHSPLNLPADRDYRNDRTPGHRIRIGYVSPDFRSHSVAFFIYPVLSHHHRDQVEVFCYADVSQPDEATQVMMNSADHWRNIYRMPDERVFQQIQDDRIDILVDLTGHSSNNRMKLFGKKPAPVQVSYLGYPNTTGLDSMDYRITDALADPVGISDAYYSERLIRLPGGFLCYQPSDPTPDVSELPLLTNHHVTFGSFNNRAKIGPKVIAVWSELLKHVPGSRLLLKSSALSDAETRQRLLSLFVQNGIVESRIEILPYLQFQDHLSLYHQIDIALDTFPYNGTTTTFEAMWMGVPVITITGKVHASRVGTSILSRIEFQDGIAASENEYIEKAVKLAKNIDFLKVMRKTLRGKMQASSLMDQEAFVLKLESAFRNMWQSWCAKLIAEGDDNPEVMDVRIKGDITLCVPNSIQYLTPYVLLEYQDWFEQEIAFVRAFLKPGMRVLDIGANYGTYALTAAKSVGPTGKVWAFEPTELTAAYFTRSIRRNRFDHVTLIQAGVSDSGRQAFLSLSPNSEMNEVSENPPSGDFESILLMSLDEGLKNNVFESNIDFLKMDAEGQEDNILKGGETFFRASSPLILYEIKHGETFHFEMVSRFLEMGYQSYRLIPGPGILAPFDIGEKPDQFQLNLFCCKPDCAEKLSRMGLLVLPETGLDCLPSVPSTLWIDYIPQLPYAMRFLPLWEKYCQEHVGDPDWQIHQQALAAYSASQLPGYPASARFQTLMTSYGLMINLLRDRATISRILSAARMAIDLGFRENAVNILKHLVGLFESAQEISVDEPFLPLSARMAAVDPGNAAGQWLVYSALETREICQSFSSYFTGKNSLPDLELMKTFPFYSDEMETRRQLIQKRFGMIE
jgi:FkbM family methyltransferase